MEECVCKMNGCMSNRMLFMCICLSVCECTWINLHIILGVGPFLTPPTVVLHFHMTVVGWMLEVLDNEYGSRRKCLLRASVENSHAYILSVSQIRHEGDHVDGYVHIIKHV